MAPAYLLRRVAHGVLVLVGASLLVFVLVRVIPGDPAVLMLGNEATPEALAELRRALGLDRSLLTQYGLFLSDCLHGNFGVSLRSQRPVLDMILESLPATLQLTGAAVLVSVLVGVPVGVLSAVRRGRAVDDWSMLLSLLAQSIPNFWLGLMLISLLAVQLRLLPVSGRGTVWHLVMPTITLSLYTLGILIRLTRAGMLEVLGHEYITSARARGVRESVLVFKHALRNALVPVIAVLGVQVGTMLGGAVVTEAVFRWPGIGELAVVALAQRDYPAIQAIVLLSATAFVVINFLADLAYRLVDPRIRLE